MSYLAILLIGFFNYFKKVGENNTFFKIHACIIILNSKITFSLPYDYLFDDGIRELQHELKNE